MIAFNDALKGISPGKYLGHRLKKIGLSQIQLAENVGEHPQTINAIIKGKRRIPTSLSMKIEEYLDLEEGFIAVMQVFYDYQQIKTQLSMKRDAPNVRRILFWDVDFDSIDWRQNRDFVIKRVLDRGSEEEILEIQRYYAER